MAVYIFLLELLLFIIHFFDFLLFLFLLQMELKLSVPHYGEFFFLEYLHSCNLQCPPAKDTQQRLDFIVKIEELVVPNLGLTL